MSFPSGDIVVMPFVGADDENDGTVALPQGSEFFEDVKGNYYDGLQNKDGEDRIALGSAVLTDGKARALSDREERGLHVNGTRGDERCILVGVEDLSSAHRARRKMALRRRNDDRNGGVVVDNGRDDNNNHGREHLHIEPPWRREDRNCD
jgi:hypothetical protein